MRASDQVRQAISAARQIAAGSLSRSGRRGLSRVAGALDVSPSRHVTLVTMDRQTGIQFAAAGQ